MKIARKIKMKKKKEWGERERERERGLYLLAYNIHFSSFKLSLLQNISIAKLECMYLSNNSVTGRMQHKVKAE